MTQIFDLLIKHGETMLVEPNLTVEGIFDTIHLMTPFLTEGEPIHAYSMNDLFTDLTYGEDAEIFFGGKVITYGDVEFEVIPLIDL